jgi:hypothetical protein
VRLESELTREALPAACAVVHAGGPDFLAVLKASPDDAWYARVGEELFAAFGRGDQAAVAEVLRREFEPRRFYLGDLFMEARREALTSVIGDVLRGFEGAYRRMVEENRALMDHLLESGLPVPHAFRVAVQYVLDRDMKDALKALDGDGVPRLLRTWEAAKKFDVPLDLALAAERVRRHVEGALRPALERRDAAAAGRIALLLEAAERMGLDVFLWRSENLFHQFWNDGLKPALIGDSASAPDAAEPFLKLADRFRVAL